jgi:hypothetical protein
MLYFFTCISCNKKNIQKPIWINKGSAYYVNSDSFIFKSNTKEWKASMLTFTQPIVLNVSYNNDILKVNWHENKGVVDGPAHICLQSGNQSFFYPMYLQNKMQQSIIIKDYRSPKTVNPDSSLIQQSIKHEIDFNRNIEPNINGAYFLEENTALAPIVKTSRAIAAEPITANYMQAGTATNVPLKASYNTTLQQYEIVAGTMYDAHKNIIANGTNVVFEYSNNSSKGIMNATTINGIATVLLPIHANENWTVVATINNIKSKKINIVK